jgi:hypothetical protein
MACPPYRRSRPRRSAQRLDGERVTREWRRLTFARGAIMEAIVTIVLFLVVILAINRYEFGRFD